MMRWLKRLGRGIELLRRGIINGVFLLLLLLIIMAVLELRPQVPQSAALLLDLQGELVETSEPWETIASAWQTGVRPQTALADVLDAIRLAGDDPRIKMIVLDTGHLAATPLARLREVRKAILDVRKRGKQVVAIGEHFDQRQYYLASAADEVVLDPMGWVALTGFGLYGPYLKDLLQRLGIEVHVFRAGRYKTAAEYLTRNDMSPEARQSEGKWLAQLWQIYKREVAAARGIREELLQRLADEPDVLLARYDGDAATMALRLQLVDRVASSQELERQWAQKLGWDEQGESYRRIRLLPYLKARKAARHFPRKSRNKVAVVYVSGPMLQEAGVPGSVDVGALTEQLRLVRKEQRFKALVLRIDSPGGSAFAAERLRREILRVKQEGKAVVVSMGAVAASGGYWIAADADDVWADDMTLTGSIGVIGVIPKLRAGLERLGIHSDGIGTGAVAGALRPDRPMPEQASRALQLGVAHAYRRFIRLVAQGRGMSEKAVASLAEGRVYSGIEAAANGLVDHIGGISQAIAAAAKLAKLGEDYEAVSLRPGGGLLRMLRHQLQTDWLAGIRLWPQWLLRRWITGEPLALSLLARP